MTEFLLALSAFLVAHIVPPAPPVRSRLVALLGRRAYLITYSALSLALLAWLVSSAIRAPYLPVWNPAPWLAAIPLLVMPLSLWLVIAGLVEPNPLSISIRRAEKVSRPGTIASITRHPVLWGFFLWSAAHVPPSGHVVALILFCGMALLSLAGMVALDRRARRRLGENDWNRIAGAAPLFPLTTPLRAWSRVEWKGSALWSLVAALLIYAWFVVDGHRRLIGPDPLAWFR